MSTSPPTPQDGAAELQLPNFGARASLRENVTEALRGAVITGTIRPGTLYSAPALAARFGVSATPVREAMLDLVKEGLVEAVRNKGFRVIEPTERELDDIAQLRVLIEVPTVSRIADGYASDWDTTLAALRETAREIVRHAERGDLIAYIQADFRFHLGLLALGGNDILVQTVGNLRSRARLYGLKGLVERGELTRSAAEHERLADLVAAGDALQAAALMRRHIGHVRGTWAGRPDTGPA